MRKLLVLALLLAGSGVAFADAIPTVVDTTTNAVWTRTVFNDNGSSIQSGQVVRWDNDDLEFDDSGYPYVVLNATSDSIYIAGVVAEGMTCADQSLCEIVVHGPTRTICADATDAVAEDTMVAGSSLSGQCGDYGPAANTCALGILLEDDGVSNDGESDIVFVNISCQ